MSILSAYVPTRVKFYSVAAAKEYASCRGTNCGQLPQDRGTLMFYPIIIIVDHEDMK